MTRKKFQILAMIFTVSGVFGFLYETLFYLIDLGYLTKRGTTLGPWIPIYGFGGVLITLLVWRFRRNPAVVLVLSAGISGVLEFCTGYALYHLKGLRLWDYNTEIWNWGNIGGYVCARSVAFFGVSGLLLFFVILPLVRRLAARLPEKIFAAISLVPAALFVLDMLVSSVEKIMG